MALSSAAATVMYDLPAIWACLPGVPVSYRSVDARLEQVMMDTLGLDRAGVEFLELEESVRGKVGCFLHRFAKVVACLSEISVVAVTGRAQSETLLDLVGVRGRVDAGSAGCLDANLVEKLAFEQQVSHGASQTLWTLVTRPASGSMKCRRWEGRACPASITPA